MSSENNSSVRVCAGHSPIFQAGESGQVWRVRRGAVRLDRGNGSARLAVQLALPGDLIGVEALCGQAYQFSAEAFPDCEIEPVTLADLSSAEAAVAREMLLRQVLLQQQARSHDMATLRTGSVMQRLVHLLRLLGLPWQGKQTVTGLQADAVRLALPTLREMAELVDAKTETVCRALAQLLPPRSRKGAATRSRSAAALPSPPRSAASANWPAAAGQIVAIA